MCYSSSMETHASKQVTHKDCQSTNSSIIVALLTMDYCTTVHLTQFERES